MPDRKDLKDLRDLKDTNSNPVLAVSEVPGVL